MSNINLGLDMTSLDVGPRQATITGVLLHAGQGDNGETIDYLAGSSSGNVLEIDVPNGTRAMAYAVLDGLKKRGYRYQPFTADSTVTDPAIEIGDNATANNVGCVVMGIKNNHSRLMASELSAPYDEEVNHEFKYEPKTQRQFKRESAYTRSRLTVNENEIQAEVVRATDAETQLGSRITINANSITAEVSRASAEEVRLSSRITATAESITSEVARATGSESNLSSRITQNADSITSEVTRATTAESNLSTRITQNATDITAKVSKTGGSSSSFAWTLTDSSWTLTSNSTTVLKATSSGIEVSGKITAKSGYIGNGSSGFTIGNTSISNGMTSRDDTENNGIYLGTNGIALGKGKFKVTNSGTLTATSGAIAGFSFSSSSFSKATPDVSTNGQTQYQFLLQAPETASATSGAIYLRHRDYNNGYGSWVNDFLVKYNGEITATKLNFTGGSISIGSNFSVTSQGALTARSGSIGDFDIYNDSQDGYVLKNWEETSPGEWANNGVWICKNYIQLGDNFKVTKTGYLEAKDVYIKGSGEFTGKVTATSGEIGGFNITSSVIENWDSTNARGVWIDAANQYIQIGKCKINSDGTIRVLNNANDESQGYSMEINTAGQITRGSMTGGSIAGGVTADGASLSTIRTGAANGTSAKATWDDAQNPYAGTSVYANYLNIRENGTFVYHGAAISLRWSDELGAYYLGATGEG